MSSVSHLIDHVEMLNDRLLKIGEYLFDPNLFDSNALEANGTFKILETDIEAVETFKQIYNLIKKLKDMLRMVEDKSLAEVKKDWHFYYQLIALLKQLHGLHNNDAVRAIFLPLDQNTEFGQTVLQFQTEFTKLKQAFGIKENTPPQAKIQVDSTLSETQRYIKNIEDELEKLSASNSVSLQKNDGLYSFEDSSATHVNLLKAKYNASMMMERYLSLKECFNENNLIGILNHLSFIASHLSELKYTLEILDNDSHSNAQTLLDELNMTFIMTARALEETELKCGFKEGSLSNYLEKPSLYLKEVLEKVGSSPLNEQYPFTINKNIVRAKRKNELESNIHELTEMETALEKLKDCLNKYTSVRLHEMTGDDFSLIMNSLNYVVLDGVTKAQFIYKINDARQAKTDGYWQWFMSYLYTASDYLNDLAGWSDYTVIIDRIDEQLELIKERKALVIKKQQHLSTRSMEESVTVDIDLTPSSSEAEYVKTELKMKYETDPFDLSWLDITSYKKNISDKRKNLIRKLLENTDPYILEQHFPEIKTVQNPGEEIIQFEHLENDPPLIQNIKCALNVLAHAETLLNLLQNAGFMDILMASPNLVGNLTTIINEAFTLDVESLAYIADLFVQQHAEAKSAVKYVNTALETLNEEIALPKESEEDSKLAVITPDELQTNEMNAYRLQTKIIIVCLQKTKRLIEDNIRKSKNRDANFILDKKTGLYKHQDNESPMVRRNIALFNTIKQLNDVIESLEKTSTEIMLDNMRLIVSIITKINSIASDIKYLNTETRAMINDILKSLHGSLGDIAASIEELEMSSGLKEGTLTQYIDKTTSKLNETDKYLDYQPSPIELPPFLIKRQLARDKFLKKTEMSLSSTENKITVLTSCEANLRNNVNTEFVISHIPDLNLPETEKSELCMALSLSTPEKQKIIEKTIKHIERETNNLKRTKNTLTLLKSTAKNRTSLINTNTYIELWTGASEEDINVIAQLSRLQSSLKTLSKTDKKESQKLEPVIHIIQSILNRQIAISGFSLQQAYNNVLTTLEKLTENNPSLISIINEYQIDIPSCHDFKELSAVAFTFRTLETQKVDRALIAYEKRYLQISEMDPNDLQTKLAHLIALIELQEVVKKWLTVRNENTSSRVPQMQWLDTIIERKIRSLEQIDPSVIKHPTL